MLTVYRSGSFLFRFLTAIGVIMLLAFGSGTAARQESQAVKTEGELQSIKQAGFTYDDVSYTSGNAEADRMLKEVTEFVNADEFVGPAFQVSMKFAFLDDSRITSPSYRGNGFYILSRNADKNPTGTIYLTKRLVNRAMATHKDLLYVLALHECGHIWQHWVLIRNGNDEDDPEMKQKMDAKALEIGADGWAGAYARKFFAKKYAGSQQAMNQSIRVIVSEYFDQGDYFVFDKSKVTDQERKTAFTRSLEARPMPYGPQGRPR